MPKQERKMVSAREALMAVLVLIVIATGFNVWDNLHNGGRINGVVSELQIEEARTSRVQAAGAPTGVCLREAIKAGEPIVALLDRELTLGMSKTPVADRALTATGVALLQRLEGPLAEYVRLQDKRYVGVRC